MSRFATKFVVALISIGWTTIAYATQYPPPGCAPCDTLTVQHIQQEVAPLAPKPIPPDTVYGIKGIITGFDTFGSGRAFYIQTRGATDAGGSNITFYRGIDIFTGQNSYPGLLLGDSVAVYGKVAEFGGGSEIEGFDTDAGSLDIIVRVIQSGLPLPAFHVGTVTELREIPKSPTGVQERWEGSLVKVRGPLRVARTSLQPPGIGTFSSFLAVDHVGCTTGPCDSLFIDGATMSFNAVAPPAVGTVIDSAQGIYDERTRGYRIQLRNSADLFAALPPAMVDAFCIEDNKIQVIYDRPVTELSSEDVDNYTLLTGNVDLATQISPTTVNLDISAHPADGGSQSVTALGIVSSSSGVANTDPTSRNLIQGVLTIAFVQAPDPAALGGAPCDDRSRFAGTGSNVGTRLSFRGVCTAAFGPDYYLQDEAGGPRSGIIAFAPQSALVRGRRYLVAGGVQEFFNLTEVASGARVFDEGAGVIPEPVVQTVAVLSDSSCDATQSVVNGEDYEGMLVRLHYVKVVDRGAPSTSPPPGGFFDVAGPSPTFTDSMDVDNDGTHTYDPEYGDVLSVTGGLKWSFARWRINPRDDADIADHGPNVGVGGEVPDQVSFAVKPNPARTAVVSFGLPHRDHVEIAVFDLQGRRVATLQKGVLDAGNHSRSWNGRSDDGRTVGSGLYFYRMRVGTETYRATGVRLD